MVSLERAWRSPCRRPKAPLTGWGQWLLLLLVPFSALGLDTWLNTETFRCDYEMAEVNRQIKALTETLDGFRVEEARLIAMDRIEMEAPDLGLVDSQPGQIKVIYYAEVDDARDPAVAGPAVAASTRGTAPVVRLARSLTGSRGEEGVNEKSWDTGAYSSPTGTTTLAARLHEVIASVYASYAGHS